MIHHSSRKQGVWCELHLRYMHSFLLKVFSVHWNYMFFYLGLICLLYGINCIKQIMHYLVVNLLCFNIFYTFSTAEKKNHKTFYEINHNTFSLSLHARFVHILTLFIRPLYFFLQHLQTPWDMTAVLC